MFCFRLFVQVWRNLQRDPPMTTAVIEKVISCCYCVRRSFPASAALCRLPRGGRPAQLPASDQLPLIQHLPAKGLDIPRWKSADAPSHLKGIPLEKRPHFVHKKIKYFLSTV